MHDDRILIPGQTCWQVKCACQFACIIDAADYFKHVKAAMLRARHRIILVGWDFDAWMTFERGVKMLPGPNQRPFTERTVADEAGPLAESDLVDPDRVPPSLTRSVQRFIAGLRN